MLSCIRILMPLRTPGYPLSISMWHILTFILIAPKIRSQDAKVPIVADHNKQIRIPLGGHLRLECPVHSTPSQMDFHNGPITSSFDSLDTGSSVMYQWRVRDRLDYMLDSDQRFRLSQNRRVLEITVPVELSDSGTYTCTGVTGFGIREVKFEVQVTDPNAELLCAPQSPSSRNIKAPCFLDPKLKEHSAITLERPAGSSVELNCEADGSPPLRYRWLKGKTIADWISTSQGTRGPALTIENIGREHTGHYTCQVENSAGKLNYTYRLIVTERPSANPKIISTLENLTLTSDTSARITAQIQCACDEPVIQWLKRVEPSDKWLYGQSQVAEIPLPNARVSEHNELFRVLGSWDKSPANVEPTIVLEKSDEMNQALRLKHTSGFSGRNNVGYRGLDMKTFVTTLEFKKPLEVEKHSGKYVLMTMSLTDVKTMEYIAIHVEVVQDPHFLKGRRMLIYFLVPFSLLFIFIGLLAYLFMCRKRKSRTHNTGHRMLRSKDGVHRAYTAISNGGKSSSMKTSPSDIQFTGKHPGTIMGANSPLLNSELWQHMTPHSYEIYNHPNDSSCRLMYYPTGSCQPNSIICSNTSTPSNTTTTYLSSSQSTKRSLPIPPANSVQVIPNCTESRPEVTGSSHSGFDLVQNHIETNQMGFVPNPSNPFLQMNYPQLSTTDSMFDQYSAISRSPISSSTMTNHYTLPYGNYPREKIVGSNPPYQQNGHSELQRG